MLIEGDNGAVIFSHMTDTVGDANEAAPVSCRARYGGCVGQWLRLLGLTTTHHHELCDNAGYTQLYSAYIYI